MEAFRRRGIREILRKKANSFRDLGDVPLAGIDVDSGPGNLRNFPQFVRNTDAVRIAAGGVEANDFAFCLGGECTFIVGSLAGFKTKFRGKPGILWMDAHGDFNTPETTPSGFIGGMCLAFACGRGPKLSSEIENSRPLMDEENVVHVGSRALDPLESKTMADSPLQLYSASDVRRIGVERVAEEAAKYLSDRADWIVCHLDVDCLDPATISAVNFPEKGGLMTEDAKTIVDALYDTGKLKVFDLAALNSDLDKDGSAAKTLLDLTGRLSLASR